MPEFESPLLQLLDALDGRRVVIEVEARPGDDAAEADRIHRLLLEKKRSGSLGLGD